MNNILSLLESYTLDNADDIGKMVAADFRRRRIEKGLTRETVSERAGVALSNIVRFEQKGLISLRNLISLAMAMGYTSEVKGIFAEPKYSTMEELTQIRKNAQKTRGRKA
ncbi:MAG: helix-turn-helix transcriptional regulator [Bacteroidaceae bacterium]|nr:helix-turn-helix transcriptional regulator [Bacteroidaceae bacterium]